MVNKLRIIGYVFMVILFLLATFLYTVFPVKAAGTTTQIVYCLSTDNYGWSWYSATAKNWYQKVYSESCDVLVGGNKRVGWNNTAGGGASPLSFFVRFDLDSVVPPDVEIFSMNLLLSVAAKYDTSDKYDEFYYSVWKTNPGADGVMTIADYRHSFDMKESGYTRVSAPQRYTQASGNVTIPLLDVSEAGDRWSDGYVYYDIVTERQLYPLAPDNEDTGDLIAIDFNAASQMYLEIEYATPADARIVPHRGNAAVNPAPLGTEVADNITWWSPRCAFSDEDLSFLVNGESGANVTMSLVDASGNVLDTDADSVRVDGVYESIMNVPSEFSGWVRCVESNFGLTGQWGRVEKSPSNTMQLLNIYAKNTFYPQYDYPMSDYIVYKDSLMYIYWKTNLELADMPDYSLRILAGGDNVTGEIFNQTFEWINDNIYCSSDNCSFLAHWRYAIFSPKVEASGFDYKDGLIQDLNADYNMINRGFLCSIIEHDSDGEVITDTHSCYFYLQSINGGLVINIGQYKSSETIKVGLTIGTDCKLGSRLSNVALSILDDSGAVKATASGAVSSGYNELSIVAPAEAGSYQLRLDFYDESLVPWYHYICDNAFVVTGGTGTGGGTSGSGIEITGWQSWIKNLLTRYNLDNESGHWLVIFILCIIIAFAFRKIPWVAMLLCTLVFAGAFIIGWLPRWFIIILLIGVGLAVYGFFKRKSAGKNEVE